MNKIKIIVKYKCVNTYGILENVSCLFIINFIKYFTIILLSHTC